tara:strand:+ start:156 stop:299 length:144 start_codon:yes stop_codon:yes gene_type:complete
MPWLFYAQDLTGLWREKEHDHNRNLSKLKTRITKAFGDNISVHLSQG